MNAETGNEPESPKRRGRIPQSAWPQILERYRAGATLSAIAREFECTPSAISYIVRKAEASGALTPGEGAAADGDEQAAAPAEAAAEAQPQAQPEPQPQPRPAPRRAAQAQPQPQPAAAPPAPAPAEARPAAEAPPAPAPAAAAPAPAPAAPPKQRLELPRAEVREAREAQRAEAQRAEAAATAAAAAPQPAPAAPAPAADAAAQAARTPGQPTPPIDAVEGRLRETARTCLAAYRSWRQQPSEASIQSLSDAVHELRKALARIEIDMSASRRDEQVMRPIPIPAHRASRRSPS